jgi:hypothetical protein
MEDGVDGGEALDDGFEIEEGGRAEACEDVIDVGAVVTCGGEECGVGLHWAGEFESFDNGGPRGFGGIW